MKFAGNDGVAAYGVIMYVNFIFISVFLGYCIGVSPIISFHYGAQNRGELKRLLKMSLVIIATISLAMSAISLLLSKPLSEVFVGYDRGLYEMTLRGFIFFCFSFLIAGFNIFGSSFFTALNNGFISAVISFLRTLLFQVASVLILPELLGLDGIWLSILLAEFLSVIVVALFISKKRSTYGY